MIGYVATWSTADLTSSTVLYCTVLYSTVQYGKVLYCTSKLRYNACKKFKTGDTIFVDGDKGIVEAVSK